MSANSFDSGAWVPLMDYAIKTGVSLSTLRRHIKAGKIRFKTEHGKYLIHSSEQESDRWASNAAGDGTDFDLNIELKKAQEEIAELKMLVAIYEERLFQNPPAQI